MKLVSCNKLNGLWVYEIDSVFYYIRRRTRRTARGGEYNYYYTRKEGQTDDGKSHYRLREAKKTLNKIALGQ